MENKAQNILIPFWKISGTPQLKLLLFFSSHYNQATASFFSGDRISQKLNYLKQNEKPTILPREAV